MTHFIDLENINNEVAYYDSPIGTIEICGTEKYLKSVLFFNIFDGLFPNAFHFIYNALNNFK